MNDTLDIKTPVMPAANRAEVLVRLRAHESEIRALGATALYLFGSAARDEMAEQSDVDLFIDYDRDSEFTLIDQLRMRGVLARLLGRETDLTTRHGLHPRLRSEIEASCIRIF